MSHIMFAALSAEKGEAAKHKLCGLSELRSFAEGGGVAAALQHHGGHAWRVLQQRGAR